MMMDVIFALTLRSELLPSVCEVAPSARPVSRRCKVCMLIAGWLAVCVAGWLIGGVGCPLAGWWCMFPAS